MVVHPAEIRDAMALFHELCVSCAFAWRVVTCSGGGRGGGLGCSARMIWLHCVRSGAGSGVSKRVEVIPAPIV
jgi:hypothetical protein